MAMQEEDIGSLSAYKEDGEQWTDPIDKFLIRVVRVHGNENQNEQER